jgi:putative oxidoreductase
MVGLFTRPTAFILSGVDGVRVFLAHAPQGFWPIVNRGELAAFLQLPLFSISPRAGGGPWSIDAWRKR